MSYLWYWPGGGWDFDAWKSRQRWQPITGAQSGRRDLMPLLADGETLADWQARREDGRRVLDDLLGTVTDQPPTRMRWEFLGATLEKRDAPGYTLRRLRYTLTDMEWGYAWLLVPSEAQGPRPAVIALHQTLPQGKAEPAGLESAGVRGGGRDYGKELAEQGFVVLVPDAIAFGERQAGHANALYRSADQFFAAHPDGSVMAKMAYDTCRAVDLLEALPEVDGTRIGSIGHSHGGYGTLFAMLYDDRIRAGVLSCGLSPLRTDPGVERWWRRTALIPRLGFYEGRIEQTPLDVHHLLALVAPRPLLVAAALDDAIFPQTDSLPGALEAARAVYRRYGAAGHLRGRFFRGAHDFPPDARTAGYALLREFLKASSSVPSPFRPGD